VDLDQRIEAELKAAEAAQDAENDGRARVCARRAAGLAIRAWYQQQDGPAWSGDAMKQLVRMRVDAAVPPGVRQAAVRLTTKVDFDHLLPFDEDPIEDARQIIKFTEKRDARPKGRL
jgi:hypothetical protein